MPELDERYVDLGAAYLEDQSLAYRRPVASHLPGDPPGPAAGNGAWRTTRTPTE